MGNISVKDMHAMHAGSNTLGHYDREITADMLDIVLARICATNSLIDNDRVCYIQGIGGHTKSTYMELDNKDGVEVACSHSYMPVYLRPFSFFVASYGGLVKIHNIDLLSETFKKLTNMSMAVIYSFNKAFEEKLINDACNDPLSYDLGLEIQKDKEYFMYAIDADNPESSTGIYEIVSYGINCPNGLEL